MVNSKFLWLLFRLFSHNLVFMMWISWENKLCIHNFIIIQHPKEILFVQKLSLFGKQYMLKSQYTSINFKHSFVFHDIIADRPKNKAVMLLSLNKRHTKGL